MANMKKQGSILEDMVSLKMSYYLKSLREKSGLGSPEDIAFIADIPTETYLNAEKTGKIEIQTLHRLLRIYGLSFIEFFSQCCGDEKNLAKRDPVKIEQWLA